VALVATGVATRSSLAHSGGVVSSAAMISPREDSFLLVEFDALRREIELRVKELNEHWRHGLLISGVIWAWLLSQPRHNIAPPAFFIPFVLSLILLAEVLRNKQGINRIGIYLHRVEQHFAIEDGLGWEKQRDRPLRQTTSRLRPLWDYFIWTSLCIANFSAGLFFRFFA